MTRDGGATGLRLTRRRSAHSNPDYRAAAAEITAAARRTLRPIIPPSCCGTSTTSTAPRSLSCYCDTCAAAFRIWLQDRYGTLGALNQAWGTAFWGQLYGDWEEIGVPRATPTVGNPAHQLDFQRFAATPRPAPTSVPSGTSCTASPPACPSPPTSWSRPASARPSTTGRWAREVDLVTNDHYLITDGRRTHVNLALAADLTRSVAGGAPWLLLEHSTVAASTGRRTTPPRSPASWPATRSAMSPAAPRARCSSSGVQSRSGAEKFHSAMLPHGGTGTRVWREVVRTRGRLGRPGRPARHPHPRRRGHGLVVGVVVGAEPSVAAE